MKLTVKLFVFTGQSLVYPLSHLYDVCSNEDTAPKNKLDTFTLLVSTVIMQSVIVLLIAGLLGVLW